MHACVPNQAPQRPRNPPAAALCRRTPESPRSAWRPVRQWGRPQQPRAVARARNLAPAGHAHEHMRGCTCARKNSESAGRTHTWKLAWNVAGTPALNMPARDRGRHPAAALGPCARMRFAVPARCTEHSAGRPICPGRRTRQRLLQGCEHLGQQCAAQEIKCLRGGGLRQGQGGTCVGRARRPHGWEGHRR